jgi:transcriptional regulator with XRE-family HTH domain
MAENLWTLREQKRLSVATLASRAGLPIGLIMEYESGQRSIDPRHLTRIARALYVEESELRLHSDPRPGTSPLERQVRKEEPRAGGPPRPAAAEPPASGPTRPREHQGRPQRNMAEPRPPAPARASQIVHLQTLLTRLGRTEQSVEAELGRPLAQIDRLEASRLLVQLQTDLKKSTAERHRPYLPEAVDQFEYRYLAAARDAQATLRFKLFDESNLTGKITGFGPYSITVQQSDGSETTLNKLAIVSYTRTSGLTSATNGKEPRT